MFGTLAQPTDYVTAIAICLITFIGIAICGYLTRD